MTLTSKALKDAIRTKYAWPGGYEVFGITSDGAVLCCNCMREEFRSIVWSRINKVNDGWRVDGIDAACNLESAEWCNEHPEEYSLTCCDHCNKVLNP